MTDTPTYGVGDASYQADFAEYLLTQLQVPAARIVAASRNRHGKG